MTQRTEPRLREQPPRAKSLKNPFEDPSAQIYRVRACTQSLSLHRDSWDFQDLRVGWGYFPCGKDVSCGHGQAVSDCVFPKPSQRHLPTLPAPSPVSLALCPPVSPSFAAGKACLIVTLDLGALSHSVKICSPRDLCMQGSPEHWGCMSYLLPHNKLAQT